MLGLMNAGSWRGVMTLLDWREGGLDGVFGGVEFVWRE